MFFLFFFFDFILFFDVFFFLEFFLVVNKFFDEVFLVDVDEFFVDLFVVFLFVLKEKYVLLLFFCFVFGCVDWFEGVRVYIGVIDDCGDCYGGGCKILYLF